MSGIIADNVGRSSGLVKAVAGGGKIGQVLSVAKTDTFTSSAQSWTDITDLTMDITPVATSSKVLIQFSLNFGGISNYYGWIRLCKDGSVISDAIGDTAGSRILGTMDSSVYSGSNYKMEVGAMMYLDSPNTTSATTYNLETWSGDGNAGYFNKSHTDTDVAWQGRPISTLTVMEVLA